MSKLKTSPALWKTIFPVAFHVDYWDGLGWPDRFARAAFTRRQRAYASSLGQESVYTPEFVVGGREWRGGRFLPRRPDSRRLTLDVGDGGKTVFASYTPVGSPGRADSDNVNIAWVGLDIASNVQRGENSGRQLLHDFVVLNFATKPMVPVNKDFKSGLIVFTPSQDLPKAVVAWVLQRMGRFCKSQVDLSNYLFTPNPRNRLQADSLKSRMRY